MTAGGFDQHEKRLAIGLQCLKACRKGEAKWRVFPFWYTVLGLLEIDLPAAKDELRFAAPLLQRTIKRPGHAGVYGTRRVEVAKRALALV